MFNVRKNVQHTQTEFMRPPAVNKPDRESLWDKAISKEFFNRARQWRDVAEFERKELLKVRVHASLKLTSSAILYICLLIIMLRFANTSSQICIIINEYMQWTGSRHFVKKKYFVKSVIRQKLIGNQSKFDEFTYCNLLFDELQFYTLGKSHFANVPSTPGATLSRQKNLKKSAR